MYDEREVTVTLMRLGSIVFFFACSEHSFEAIYVSSLWNPLCRASL